MFFEFVFCMYVALPNVSILAILKITKCVFKKSIETLQLLGSLPFIGYVLYRSLTQLLRYKKN